MVRIENTSGTQAYIMVNGLCTLDLYKNNHFGLHEREIFQNFLKKFRSSKTSVCLLFGGST